MIRKKGYEMKDYAAWLKAWETYNLHFYSVPAWLILALVFSLIAGIAFAVARGKPIVPAPGGLADGDSGGEPAMENIRCEVSSHLIFRTIVGN